MNNSTILAQKYPSTWLKIIVVSLLILGIFFRFSHLGQKIYWFDETFTSLAISGHTLAEVKEEVFNHESVIPITTLDQYQHLNPERGIADTMNYLITSDPQHPPLYYVMARLWVQIFGDSPTEIRSLSALISLLIFPCVYWLCIELFNSPIVAWVALGLIAISPLEIFFAQEARQYGLWMVIILLSSASLLRAMRKETILSWGIYSLTLTLGLYTHLFMILVAIAQGVYILVNPQFRNLKTLRNYLLAGIGAFLFFLPWLIILINNIHTALQLNLLWSESIINNPFERIALFFIRGSRTFFDINLASDNWLIKNISLEGPIVSTIILIVLSFCFILYLLYFWTKNNSKGILFVGILGTIPFLCLLICDLLFGGSLAIHPRYTLPLYLSLQIAVAYICSYHIFRENSKTKGLWAVILSGFIIAGMISSVTFFNAQSWWTEVRGSYFIKMAQTMNENEQPLLISENCNICIGASLTLSRRLDSKAHLLTIPLNEPVTFPLNYSNVFFVDRDSNLLHQLQQDTSYSLTLIDPSIGFWVIKKKST
ncbi:glycosyltransferase family 39 protein [Crocosphaera sp. XPORK-15E]|uniref:glycosyltransferase family 39 protein n=1 Tax=Crocosphaera sp. XPORK-15E TaxID=3110247 RepID=UPI002B201BCD|nr:glycosyltransferase family 39 protein [Crocosphaera sp. XPORK-15E]MEA5536951.1 glycosyltransferase family 39 protein [Crocosphaera sp. XPORK-15E]